MTPIPTTSFLLLPLLLLHSLTPSLTATLLNETQSLMSYDPDTRAWCRTMRATPEPDLLFYNRIPKCASTTMQQLFREISKKNINILALNMNNTIRIGHNILLTHSHTHSIKK
jgi:hypothetical protein